MIRTMAEISEDSWRDRRVIQEELTVEQGAGREVSAARAIGDELDRLEAVAAELLTTQNRLRVKARALYTQTQVGDAQASEASLVSGPLRRELEAVRRAWSAETVRREDAERKLAESMAADHQNIVDQRQVIKDLESQIRIYADTVHRLETDVADRMRQRDRMAEAARRAQDTSSVLQDKVQQMAEDISRLTAELGRRYTLAQVMDQRAEAREELKQELAHSPEAERLRDALDLLARVERMVRTDEVNNALEEVNHRPDPGTLARAVQEVRTALVGFS